MLPLFPENQKSIQPKFIEKKKKKKTFKNVTLQI